MEPTNYSYHNLNHDFDTWFKVIRFNNYNLFQVPALVHQIKSSWYTKLWWTVVAARQSLLTTQTDLQMYNNCILNKTNICFTCLQAAVKWLKLTPVFFYLYLVLRRHFLDQGGHVCSPVCQLVSRICQITTYSLHFVPHKRGEGNMGTWRHQ